jgi:glycosyltransferase involved in cell wall biosynthesis
MVDRSHKPLVSVVLSVFDGEAHLQAAIDSVLAQTFTDFELIIVDDGSGDRSVPILATAAAADPRIVVLTNPVNRGLTPSLNRGLAAARGALIARQDADDLSAPERLSRQVAFFEAHPRVGLRARLTADVVGDRVGIVGDVEALGESLVARLFSLIVIGDLVSVSIAERADMDPMPVDVIESLKRRLAEEEV